LMVSLMELLQTNSVEFAVAYTFPILVIQ